MMQSPTQAVDEALLFCQFLLQQLLLLFIPINHFEQPWMQLVSNIYSLHKLYDVDNISIFQF